MFTCALLLTKLQAPHTNKHIPVSEPEEGRQLNEGREERTKNERICITPADRSYKNKWKHAAFIPVLTDFLRK